MSFAIAVAIFMIGLLFLQHNQHQFEEEKRDTERSSIDETDLEELKKDFEEYKKRVDMLTLKAGFKL